MPKELPQWTVHYNIVSPESPAWVGTGWEFFDTRALAEECYLRQRNAGNVPTLRPFHANDEVHLGATHRSKL